MNERIDHAAKAAEILDWFDPQNRPAETATAHAVLALVEQQRIQNLIALASNPHGIGPVERAAIAGFAYLDENDQTRFRPEIAAALGLEGAQS